MNDKVEAPVAGPRASPGLLAAIRQPPHVLALLVMGIKNAALDPSTGIWKATDIFDGPQHGPVAINCVLMNFSGTAYHNLIGIAASKDNDPRSFANDHFADMTAGFHHTTLLMPRPEDNAVHSVRIRLYENGVAGRPPFVLREVDVLYQVPVVIL